MLELGNCSGTKRMKCFEAALLTLLLAVTVVGIPAPVTERPTTMPPPYDEPEIYAYSYGISCCSYQPQDFDCSRMKDYNRNYIKCPLRGIVFLTKNNKMACADPRDEKVQICMVYLLMKYQLESMLKTLNL